ncbi:MAG TPA: DNA translocase FtsK 4TM domain-containing protein, partial [Pyrinomonadaceae bacterium]|nr:DNA translocase FtsK 4TM domain-containing protein [Pyrinomonadaceae bacterium]
MATTQTEVRASKTAAPKNTRRNEIIAILLCAVGVLLALCLVSYRPNDPSWNTAAAGPTRNWIGPFGANVAATLFQFVGLAAYLLPLLLLAAAWRRFRTRRIRAPLSRIVGLLTLVMAASALFNLYVTRPLADMSFRAGGFAGALISDVLVSALNTTGATILLAALTATGLLLATNFSFVRAYEWLGGQFGNRFTFFRNLPVRFGTWRVARRERAQERMNMR